MGLLKVLFKIKKKVLNNLYYQLIKT